MKLSDIKALLVKAAANVPDNPPLQEELQKAAARFVNDRLVVDIGDTLITIAAEDHFRVELGIVNPRLDSAHVEMKFTSEGIITDAVARSGEVTATESIMYDDCESRLQ